MALNPVPYATVSVGTSVLRFFKVDGNHTDSWCAYEDLINCLGLQDWASRISVGTPGIICGALPGSVLSNDAGITAAAPQLVLVAGVGNLNAIPVLTATTLAANSPRTGPAQQALQAAVLTAIVTGQSALP
jgi:hypothetical protein